jgi:serine/threonine protein kinase/tetratricopeptide (TPR) repeat protein
MNEESLFHEALAKPAGERAAFLDAACGGDAELRRRVEVLLQAHEQPGSFLAEPAAALEATAESGLPNEAGNERSDAAQTERSGTVIGPYKLLQEIGEGGMGTVWMAEQTQPVHRKVALKIIKAGMDSRHVLARFEAERQALALMDHPHIAKVLDAGATPEGRPYFVMELVKGQPITKYCDEHRLTPKERLELFVPVCQAIQHAHQKGIIHRDIKPSNVLIAPYDGKPVVKVIDFGVAKATGQQLTDKTLFTEFGAVVGTLEYMSPEQAELNNQDIDTRSDIYSLGVLLYELLTGTTPLDRKRLKEAALMEVLRVIREEEPPRPSTRLSQSKDSLPSVSAQRHMEPVKLTKLVRGELDWIVMKALDKDRSRRYETANGLAMDVQRYLRDDHVLACPPSAGYRLRKFAWQHRVALATAIVIALALVVGTAVSTWQAVRATLAKAEAGRQRDAATKAVSQEKLANTLLADLLSGAVPEENARDKKVSAEKLFHQAVQKVISHPKFKEDPEVEANLRLTIGNTYYRLGVYPEAESYLRQAIELRASTLGSEHLDTLAAEEVLADLLCYGVRRPVEAELLSRRLWEVRRRLLGPEHPDTLESLDTYASTLGLQNRLQEAEALSRQCWGARTNALGTEDEKTLISQNNLSVILLNQGRYREAESLLRECLAIRRRVSGIQHVETFAVMNNLAYVLFLLGQLEDAEKLLHEAMGIVLRSHGNEHPASLHVRHMLARVLLDKGRHDQAEPFAREALTLRRKILEFGHENIGRSLLVLGRLLVETNRAAEAEPLLREAENLFREHYPAKQDQRGEAECRLGACLLALLRYPEAETMLLAGWAKLEATPAMPLRQKEQILMSLVKLYESRDEKAQAAAWAKKLETQRGANKKAEQQKAN